jgi:hypothetical protein
MTIKWHYDDSEQVFYEVCEGEITYAAIIEYLEEVKDLALPDNIRVLGDYTACKIMLSPEEVEQLDSYIRDYVKRIQGERVALCASSDLGFGLARRFATLLSADSHEMLAFRTLAEGREWLGLPQVRDDSVKIRGR